jgi:Tfp pilus assembly protein PilO
MTYTDEFGFNPEFEEENYPTAFGITFTPQISGIALGILGALVALYAIFSFGIPAWENYQKLKLEEQEKQEQIAAQKSQTSRRKFLETESNLKQAKATKAQILSLFSSEQTIDTLLFDISNLASAKKVKLTSFQPKVGGAMVIDDGSLGREVNNKLKRETIEVEMAGSFGDTQAFLQDLERLQPLLLVKNINFSLDTKDIVGTVKVDNLKKTATVKPAPQNDLKTTFTLEVILPLSTEEMQEITATKEAESKEKK